MEIDRKNLQFDREILPVPILVLIPSINDQDRQIGGNCIPKNPDQDRWIPKLTKIDEIYFFKPKKSGSGSVDPKN